MEYLNEVSPLQFYSETNIGSRPSKRKNSGKLELKDLGPFLLLVPGAS